MNPSDDEVERSIVVALHALFCDETECMGEGTHEALATIVHRMAIMVTVSELGRLMTLMADDIVSDDTPDNLRPGLQYVMERVAVMYKAGITKLAIPYMNMN